ncbi:TlpA family protein disulfide reductase [Dechloromonas denitrificans]|uniref:TlpA family protein disulfide reductase n=1 Tax=Dechloromonas denitrificans TaxID=281362 RepID=UPI001CF85D66|nr:TlpA disulfide reductase family protein [Dechloromonas denitrificans]UCV10404.1 TlpA family protein disulfide reductase [Dechloromonas denitrificans]
MRIFLLILALFLSACGKEAPKANVNIGSIAPTFQTFRADGGAEHFPAAYFGKPLVIRFWADWCKYCEGEMKAIETVYQANKGKLQVLAINAGQDKATINAFIKKIGVTYPALLDENSAIARSYGVVGLPTTFFIDSKGIVRAKIVGEADEATFARHAQALLQ